MTNRSNDDIARALQGLSSGEHSEPQPGPGDTGQPVPEAAQPLSPPPPRQQPAPPVPPVRPSPSTPVPAGRLASQPKPAAPARPARPVEPGATPPPRRAAAPGLPIPPRPVAPAVAPPVPPVVARAFQPQSSSPAPAPYAPAAQPVDFVQGDGAHEAAAAADDDVMMMPAPSSDYLAHVSHAPAYPRRSPAARSAGWRLTMVPVLVTCAALMLAAVVLKFVVNPDAPLALMPLWLVGILAAAAVVFVAVAVLNVLQARRPASTAGAGKAGGAAAT